MTDFPVLPNTLIRASAGSGKTYELVHRYLSIVARGEHPSRILATTFTRKAAGEIYDRVLRRIAEALADPRSAKGLAEAVGMPGLTGADIMKMARTIIGEQHRLLICTLDGFFFRLMKAFSFEVGLSQEWRLVTGLAQRLNGLEAVRAVFMKQKQAALSELISHLNRGRAVRNAHSLVEQAMTAFHSLFRSAEPNAWLWLPDGKVPSTDELRALADRFRSAALPLTAKGAPDKRIEKAVLKIADLVQDGDLHGAGTETLLQQALFGDGTFYKVALTPDLLDASQALVEPVRGAIFHELFRHQRALYQMLVSYDEAYERVQDAMHQFDFKDVVYRLASAQRLGSLEEMYYRIDCSIAHVLLDEFQDTAGEQWRILEPMVDEILSKSGTGHTFFCVGDVKQAIYGWRGGVSSIFSSLQNRYPQLKVEVREITRRCSQPIIDTVNQVFAGLADTAALAAHQSGVAAWVAEFVPHKTHRNDVAGYSELELVQAESDEPLENFAAQKVIDLAARHPGASIGVLVRSNLFAAKVVNAINQLNPALEVSEEGGSLLTDSELVRVILALLWLADHPGDTTARFHLSISPLKPLLGIESHTDDAAALRVSHQVRHSVSLIGYGRTTAEWVQQILPFAAQRDRARLNRLVDLAMRYDGEPQHSADGLVQRVRHEKIDESRDVPVRVMTIHGSKGLEFDLVVLPELHARLLRAPAMLTRYTDRTRGPEQIAPPVPKDLLAFVPEFSEMHAASEREQLNDGLSTLYVALTRARYGLFMLAPGRAPSKKESASVPQTFAAALTEVLGAGAESGVVFTAGDPNFTIRSESPPAPPAVVSRAAPHPVYRPRTRFERVSPSRIERSERIDIGRILSPESIHGMKRGSLYHRFFELIEWIEDGDPSDESLQSVIQACGVPETDGGRLRDEFLRALQAPAVRAALSRAALETLFPNAELEVLREESLALRIEEGLVVGSLDRLVIARRDGRVCGATVVDFKTDLFFGESDAWLRGRHAVHRPQLETYLRMVRQLWRLDADQVHGSLLFVSTGAIVAVSCPP